MPRPQCKPIPMENVTIFLADDDNDDRLLFTEALSELPFDLTVQIFDNGVDLMANLLDLNFGLPNLIFLDLNMPLMNGEECLEDIRSETNLISIPIIIYSSYLDAELVTLLQKKGANHYLQKPSNFNDLKELLNKAISTVHSKEMGKNFIIG